LKPIRTFWGKFVLIGSNRDQTRRGIVAAAMACMLAGCATTTPSTAPGSGLSFDSQSNYIVEAQARGRPLRLKVDPGAPFYVLLNDRVAKELHLVSTKSATLAVGPMRLKANTRNEKLTIKGVTAAKPVMWVKGEAIPDADGIINPANLPGNDVTLRLREPRPNEQVIELAMRFDRQRGLYYEFDYGGQLILTRFTLDDRLTTTTGAAASVIAKRRNGLWDGGPFVHEVRFGIPRPVRRMVLGETLSVKGFPVNAFAVRMHDDRGSYVLPDKQAPMEEDEDGIVITGKGNRSYGAPHFWMMVGSDDLSRCSSVSYATKAKRLTLRCLTTPS
jgi:hypothetical protein